MVAVPVIVSAVKSAMLVDALSAESTTSASPATRVTAFAVVIGCEKLIVCVVTNRLSARFNGVSMLVVSSNVSPNTNSADLNPASSEVNVNVVGFGAPNTSSWL